MRRLLIYVVVVFSILELIPSGLRGQASTLESPSGSAPSALCSVRWGDPAVFGTGDNAAVAINGPSGLFVEMNTQRKTFGSDLVYRIGRASSSAAEFSSPTTFGEGYNTGVSINTDGVLIEVHEYQPPVGGIGNDVYYRIGKINLGGGTDQKIDWSSPIYSYDGGKSPQVAINDRYQVVEVHETNSILNKKLYYHIGFIFQTGEKYYIQWMGGPGFSGIAYDEGRHPHVALDNDGNVIEVHQASSSNNLHYRRGHLTPGGIAWETAAPNGRYETGDSQRPAVALRNDGFVLEVHDRNSTRNPTSLNGKYGQINPRSKNIVDWDGGWSWPSSADANISMDGLKAISVFTEAGASNLRYRAGELNCR